MRYLCVVFVALCLLSIGKARASEMVGSVGYVEDGDTFELCNEGLCVGIRLCGIDSPERREAGYHEAAIALANILKNKSIRCIPVGGGTPCDGRSKKKNGSRVVAQCFAAVQDVAAQMVREGHACDCERFSGGRYSNGSGTACPTGELAKRGCPDKKRKH